VILLVVYMTLCGGVQYPELKKVGGLGLGPNRGGNRLGPRASPNTIIFLEIVHFDFLKKLAELTDLHRICVG
jgi:hypothetical protein